MTGVATSLSSSGFQIPAEVVGLGLVVGMTYGILAVGLVLVYRANRIVNFAHGEIGAFGAAVFSLIVVKYGVPYWVGLPVALAVSAAIGMLAEATVIRRLRNAPRLMSIVATLGVGQFLLLFSLAINSSAGASHSFPRPPFLPEFDIGAQHVSSAHTAMIVMTPAIVLAIVLFLRRSRVGRAMRSAAANPDAARLSGIFANRMSSVAWAIAGAVSAYTAIMTSPGKGLVQAADFGPGLLLRAMVAAVIARMTSLPIALAAGLGIGVTEQILLWNTTKGGVVEMALFGAILLALLIQRRVVSGREEEKGSWAAVQAWQPLPAAVRGLPSVRWLGRAGVAITLVVALLLPAILTNADATIVVSIGAFAIVGLSVGIITGLGGQLTLGQFALAGIGATASYYISARLGLPFPLALLGAGLLAAAVSVLIGLPALRSKGLMLAVTTLALALATQAWLLQQSWMLGRGVNPGRPVAGNFVFDTSRRYYYFALAILVATTWLARNLRRSGFGRRLIAVRDNEENARAFTVHARNVKLQAFAVSGFLAGIGGAVYGHLLSQISSETFSVGSSIKVVAMSVLGGLGVLAGPLVGAIYIIGAPQFVHLDSAGLAATSAGWLLVIMYAPGGLAQIARPLRDRLVAFLGRREEIGAGEATEIEEGTTRFEIRPRAQAAPAGNRDPAAASSCLLAASHLAKSFGGITAVADVSLSVDHGEIVGLIGPNGAGKTTTFELLGGFTRPDDGTIVFDGVDVTRLGPERRARQGLVRSFQDAALFPTMTVWDSLRLALERTAPTHFPAALFGLPGAERRKAERADEVLTSMGLGDYRDRQIRELSTGTRRITELACLITLEPVLLLLDEPSSGIAQRETEALGQVLRDIREQLGLTMVVIEHDMPLIMGLADRIVAMDAGGVIAMGPPEVVRADPRVVEAYLGGDVKAINRSTASRPRVKRQEA